MIQAIKQFLCNQERKKFKQQEEQRPIVTGRYPNIVYITITWLAHLMLYRQRLMIRIIGWMYSLITRYKLGFPSSSVFTVVGL